MLNGNTRLVQVEENGDVQSLLVCSSESPVPGTEKEIVASGTLEIEQLQAKCSYLESLVRRERNGRAGAESRFNALKDQLDRIRSKLVVITVCVAIRCASPM